MPRQNDTANKDTVPAATPTTAVKAPPVVGRVIPGMDSPNTAEANAHIHGVYQDFQENVKRYSGLIAQALMLQARLELAEKMVSLVRDQLQLTIAQAGCAATPLNWEMAFTEVRFVGVRLTDACMTLVQERGKLTPEELLKELNRGMFRFRTSAPLREIHAALIKQKRVKKIGDQYVWAGGGEQISLRMKLAEPGPAPIVTVEEKAS